MEKFSFFINLTFLNWNILVLNTVHHIEIVILHASVKLAELVRLEFKEHKRAFNSDDVKSKLVCTALETDHVLNFDKVKVLGSGVKVHDIRMLLEGVFTKLQPPLH